MKNIVGSKLRGYRLRKNESIASVARSIGVDRTYVSKLENNRERPTTETLNSLISHFSLSEQEAAELFLLTGYRGGFVVERRKEVNENMSDNQKDAQQQSGVQFNFNRDLSVLYSDSVVLTSNPYGFLLDFAVSLGPTGQQNTVSRIGMSKEHAKALAENILRLLSADQQKARAETLKN